MPTIPSGTKFMGVNPDVNTDEKRSSLSNSYQEFYTIDDIVAEASAADTNIYNSDGALDANRTVDLDGNTLNFSGGNVGINQPTPTVPLHIKSTAIPSTNENIIRLEVSDAPTAYLAFNNAALTNGEFVPEVVGRQGASSTQSAIYQGGYIDATQDSGTTPVTVFRSALASLTQVVTRPLFAFRNWSTTVMTILADGKVGIGTTAPSTPLHVRSTAVPSSGEEIARFDVSDDTSSFFRIWNSTTIDASCVPTIEGRSSGSNVALGIIGTGATDTGSTPITVLDSRIGSASATIRPLFQFRNFGAAQMTMLANGNLGIGTTTPSEKLEVSGKTKTTTFQMTTAPTAGYVLTSDASGNGTWAAPASSSGRFGIADSAGVYTYYTTLSAAITAAVSGQTVEFFTDYTETGNVPINLKDGVNINGNGHTYTCTYSAGSISIFVNATGTQTVSNLTIIGTGMNASSSGFYISFTAQRTYFSGVVIRMDNGYGSSTFGGGIVDGLIVSVTGTARGLGVNGGKYVNCQAFSTNGEAIYCPLANGTVDNCRGESTGNVGIYGGGIYNCYAIGSNAGIWLQGGGGAYNCTGISSAGIGIYITGGSAVHHNLTGISTASIGIRVYAPSIKINGFMAYSTASNAYIGFTDTYAVNGYAESTAAASGYGGGQNMNTYFLSSWNNASGHAFTITDACQFAECIMETTSASANSIYCASPVSIKYTGCKFKTATTPVNANVTQAMVNTEDAYGNVKM